MTPRGAMQHVNRNKRKFTMTDETTRLISAHEANRRGFMRTATVAIATLGISSTLPAFAASKGKRSKSKSGGSDDIAILQGALALEHEGIGVYQVAGASGILSKDVLKVALNFLGHHKGHRDALAALITKAGANPVDAKPEADYIAAHNLGSLKTQGDIMTLAATLEKGAANAYVGQIAALQDHQLGHLFAQLATDEAVYWAVYSAALGNPIPEPAFLFG